MTVNTERMLAEIIQSNLIPQNIGGIQFNSMTLNDFHLEEIEELETVDEIIEYASLIGLAMKGVRAVNKKGAEKEKIMLFWKSDEFQVPQGEESLQSRFGTQVLIDSDMEYFMVEEPEEIDTDSMLDGILDEDGEEVEIDANGRPIVSAA